MEHVAFSAGFLTRHEFLLQTHHFFSLMGLGGGTITSVIIL